MLKQGGLCMRASCFFIAQICLCGMSFCYAKEKAPSFRALILHEKGTLREMHFDDAKGMKKTFKSIGNALERPLHIFYCETSKTSMHKIQKWSSKIGSKDIVILYYSGPDVQKGIYSGLWPLIRIGKDEIPLDLLANQIYSKHAKLSLVFADCYNSFLKLRGGEKRPYGNPLEKIKSRTVQRRVKHIWSSASGTLTMCSAKHGEYSKGIILGRAKFGAFTEALLSTITYGTVPIVGIDSHKHHYSKMVNLIDFPNRISFFMQKKPFSSKEIQIPFYSSTILGG